MFSIASETVACSFLQYGEEKLLLASLYKTCVNASVQFTQELVLEVLMY